MFERDLLKDNVEEEGGKTKSIYFVNELLLCVHSMGDRGLDPRDRLGTHRQIANSLQAYLVWQSSLSAK